MPRQSPPRLMALWLFLLLAAATALSQTSIDAFRNILRTQATLAPADFTALDQGQLVAKLLPVSDKREVAVFGVVRLNAPLEVFLRSVRDDVGRQNNEAILQIGKFSNPPVIDDLQALTLEARDLEDLKRCTAGDCRVKLSAVMIQRLRSEVDWAAPDYAARATLLFKQMLLEYVRDYVARGNAALIQYNDRSNVVRVEDEQRALIGNTIYFNDFAPEFLSYVKASPPTTLPGVEDSICWSKIKFGLKPVITITHVAIYHRQKGGAPQALVASKQLYANHYFDSSLALTAYVNIPGDTSYLLYTNRSRADALSGAFGGLKRVIVEKQALDGLKTILKGSKQFIESGGKLRPESGNESNSQSTPRRLLGWVAKHWFVSGALLAILIVLLFWLNSLVANRRRS